MEAVTHKTRRGFSLIEAAIVLAVVGAVIGGIWSAASAVRENQKQSATEEMIILAVNKMRNILKNVHDDTYPDSYIFDNVAVGVGAIPSNKLTPYGIIRISNESEYGGNDFAISLSGINKGACYRIVKKFSDNAQNYSLSRVVIYNADTGAGSSIIADNSSFPISQANLDKCQDVGGRIALQFNWN